MDIYSFLSSHFDYSVGRNGTSVVVKILAGGQHHVWARHLHCKKK